MSLTVTTTRYCEERDCQRDAEVVLVGPFAPNGGGWALRLCRGHAEQALTAAGDGHAALELWLKLSAGDPRAGWAFPLGEVPS